MKKVMLIGILLCMVMSLTACDLKDATPEAMHQTIDGIVGWFGSGQLSKDDELIGKRTAEDALFSGRYTAQVAGETGRDVVFGGSSILTRTIRLDAEIKAEAGTAEIRVRMNDGVIPLIPDVDGKVTTVLHFVSGGNYIMVDYADFTGTIEMTCEELQGEENRD